ncbi:MAG: hypothetical protein Q7R93_04860 [bacterium]|nr:hypothetical protein [bacterium]
MSDVEFSEEKAYNAALEDANKKAAAKDRSISSLPIRLGLAKDETGSIIVLVGVGLLAFVLAAVIFFSAS